MADNCPLAARRIEFLERSDASLRSMCEAGAKLDGLLQNVDPHSVTAEFFADLQSLSDDFEEYHRRIVAAQREFAGVLAEECRWLEREREYRISTRARDSHPASAAIFITAVTAALVLAAAFIFRRMTG